MAETSNCEMCNNFVYDDEDECYVCDMDLDEDDICLLYTSPSPRD